MQAGYIEDQIRVLSNCEDAAGVFIYVFSFPVNPYSEVGVDKDMTSYSLVKCFRDSDPRSKRMPQWEPKEAFYRVGSLYTRLANGEKLATLLNKAE